MKISGSVVAYHTPPEELTKVCNDFLKSEAVCNLMIIDNSATDFLRQHIVKDERVQYVFNNENLGYGKAHNIALKRFLHTTDYHVVLNTDISFDTDCIPALTYFMETHPKVGLVMPKITYPNGEIQYLCKNNPTPYLLFARRFLSAFSSKNLQEEIAAYENRDKDYEKEMFHIPFLSGCFMFLRNQTLQQSGLFDEKIFMYTEDADLTRRIMQVSETAYYPAAVATHNFRGGVKSSWKLTWYGLKSAIYYFNKWGWSIPKKN